MTKPFGPALNAAVNLLQQQVNQTLNQIISEEAINLDLKPGWQANVQQRAWVWPEPEQNPEPETGPSKKKKQS